MNYQEYAREKEDIGLNTGIHTRIDQNRRISSIYRRYANQYFDRWGWETFLWEDEKRIKEYDVLDSADEVVNLHVEISQSISLPGEET